MLISLGLDSAMGGLEAVIVGIMDEFQCWFKRKKINREIFTSIVIFLSFLISLINITQVSLNSSSAETVASRRRRSVAAVHAAPVRISFRSAQFARPNKFCTYTKAHFLPLKLPTCLPIIANVQLT